MAHFKDIQTNSSCLTYPFPPPTVIAGLVAAVLGLEKDSYYEALQPDRCFLAVEPLVPIRKSIFTVNYQITFEKGVTQIPFEILLPETGDEVVYRIFFACDDRAMMDRLEGMIRDGRSTFPPCLGSANCLATIEYAGTGKVTKLPASSEATISTILRGSGMELAGSGSGVKLVPAYMRRSFEPGRKPGRAEKYFMSTGTPPVVRATGNLYELAFADWKIHACRM